MNWFIHTFQTYPELAIFLTLGFGYWIGGLKFGTFSLGAVTGTLLVGLLVGQMQINIPAEVKSTFFLMFLFAVGYGVGPQFVRGLKSDGVPLVIFAVIQCVICLAGVILVGKMFGYDMGLTAGLFAGSQTISAVLGVASDSINQLGISADSKQQLINSMPVAYAVTYIFGTAGSAWFLATMGPKIMRVDLATESRKLEEEMGADSHDELGVFSANRPFTVRAFRVTNEKVANRSVNEVEKYFLDRGHRVFVVRVRQQDNLMDATPEMVIRTGDTIVLSGRLEFVLEDAKLIGSEVDDKALLDFPVEVLDVVLIDKTISMFTLGQLANNDFARGVGLRKLVRSDKEMPFTSGTKLDRGDVLTIVGAKQDVERVATKLGYPDRSTETTNMISVGIGIVAGGLIGALTIHIGGIPISLSTSGGALFAGLLFGWLRSVNRKFGPVPGPALWIMNSLGLNAFIAAVGITAGPGFVIGLQQSGVSLFIAGIIATTVPLLIGVILGHYVFKFHPAITLGAVAGARTTTAALGLIQDAAKSKTPALGYTVPYAVGNTLLIISGLIIVLIMS